MFQHRTSGYGNKSFGHRVGQWFQPAAQTSGKYNSLKSPLNILFTVYQFHFHPEFTVQMLCQMLRRINRTVLSSRTAEANGQVTESPLHISLYRSIHQRIDRFEKTENFSILFKESDYRFVQSRERLVAVSSRNTQQRYGYSGYASLSRSRRFWIAKGTLWIK